MLEGRLLAVRVLGCNPMILRLHAGGYVSGHHQVVSWFAEKNQLLFKDNQDQICATVILDETKVSAFKTILPDKKINFGGSSKLSVTSTVKSQFEIVVARYKERTEWLEHISPNITVYNKGGDEDNPGGWKCVPNVGRESSGYLRHIVNNWDHLADRTLFIQGNPWHTHRIFPLREYAINRLPFVCFFDRCKILSGTSYVTEACKRAYWARYVCTEFKHYSIYTMGGQFAADRQLIHERGKKHWEDLYELSQREKTIIGDREIDDYTVCALFEQSWPYLMNYERAPVNKPVDWPSMPVKMTCSIDSCLKHWDVERASGRIGWGIEV